MRSKSILYIPLVIFFLWNSLSAHAPKDRVMYPVAKIYAQKGLTPPTMTEDVIAIVGDEKILLKEYKDWLLKKVGLTPVVKERYFVEKYLEKRLLEAGVNVDVGRREILAHVYQFVTYNKVYEKREDWVKDMIALYMAEKMTPGKGVSCDVGPDEYDKCAELLSKKSIQRRSDEFCFLILYVILNWDKFYSSLFEAKDVDKEILNVSIDDPMVKRMVQLNNAYYVVIRYLSNLAKMMRDEIFEKGDVSIFEDRQGYIDWVFEKYQTSFLTENYLSLYLLEKKAKEEEIQISEAHWQKIFQRKIQDYHDDLRAFNAKGDVPEVIGYADPEYIAYLGREMRIDLLGSRVYRNRNPLKAHDVAKRFYDEAGYKGERYKVSEIFKWVRKRSTSGKNQGYEQYVEKEEAKLKQEFEDLRKQIIKDELNQFPYHAIVENEIQTYQNLCGKVIDLNKIVTAEIAEQVNKLPPGEISEVMKTAEGTFHMFWRSDEDKQLYQITRRIPLRVGFDFRSYDKDMARAKKELNKLKGEIGSGKPIDVLAEQHSDSFKKQGSDISDIYQKRYGYIFTKQLSEMSEGDLRVITTKKGAHLVQLKSKTKTPYTKQTYDRIVRDFNYSIASDGELNVLSKELLYEADPYY